MFKTFSDPFSGRVSLFRVYSGTLQSDHAYWNTTRDHEERVGKLQVLQGKQQIPVPELRAGDIGAVAKLKDTFTGDTIAAKDHPIVIEHIHYPEAAIAFAVEPKARGDEDKLGAAIHRIIEEDPTIKFARDEQTKEFLISGQGQLHVEIVVAKLKKKYNVDVVLHPPKVPYRETITQARRRARPPQETVRRPRPVRRLQDHRWSRCRAARDFEFVDEIFGGSIPRQYIPAVEKGIQDARVKGYLAGFPVVDFRVRLKDGQYHDVDSSEMAFKIAGSLAFQEGMAAGAPDAARADHARRHHRAVANTSATSWATSTHAAAAWKASTRKRTSQVVHARVPFSEMLTYGSTLRSLTQGRGSFHMEYSHYEEVPKQLQEKIIAESKKAKEAQAAAH